MRTADALAAAQMRKTLEMERSVSQIRALVIGANILIYFTLFDLHGPRSALAIAVIVLAAPYAVWSLLGRPYERFPLLRFGALTLCSDVLLTTLWVLGTGGERSEFWIIYVVSVVSVAMRYDLRQTVIAAAAEAAVYASVFSIDGLRGAALATRPIYILIAGMAAGLLARMERTSREERVVSERLAAERATMLEREREAGEKLRELDHLKTEFVAHASHELRTPLTTLSGLALMLSARRGEMTQEEIDGCFEAMGRQGERARQLIERLLDLSKLDADMEGFDLSAVSLVQAVKSALESAPVPEDKQLTLSIDSGLSVSADPLRLEQVLANLLVNAYRHGGEHIAISAHAAPDDDVEITIEDDGLGVRSESVQRLFEPFARGQDADGTSGSGLGLTISARLVKAMGGSMWYEPRAEGGTVFKIKLARV